MYTPLGPGVLGAGGPMLSGAKGTSRIGMSGNAPVAACKVEPSTKAFLVAFATGKTGGPSST